MLSRKHVPQEQIQVLLSQGIVLVSVDFRLCPEVNILDGPMTDTREALQWVRTQLPQLTLKHRGLCLDGDRVGVIGWSSGGTLALLLGQAWDIPGYRPPEAIVSFYCPTDFEDPCEYSILETGRERGAEKSILTWTRLHHAPRASGASLTQGRRSYYPRRRPISAGASLCLIDSSEKPADHS